MSWFEYKTREFFLYDHPKEVCASFRNFASLIFLFDSSDIGIPFFGEGLPAV